MRTTGPRDDERHRSASDGRTGAQATDAEKWILSRLAQTCAEVETQFAAYRFDLASQALYEFTWNEFCDWFLELAKPALMADASGESSGASANATAAATSTRRTLLTVLEATLRLLHPLLPFVTEEIWFEVAPRLGLRADRGAGDSVSVRPYPSAGEFAGEHVAAAADIEWLKAIVTQLRRIRSEMNVSPARAVLLLLADGNAIDRARMARFESALRFLARVESIQWLEAGVEPPPAATGVVGGLRMLIPLAGLIDLDAERARLARELTRIANELAKCEAKLGSETFVANAPAAVVATERTRLADWQTQHATLAAQLARLA